MNSYDSVVQYFFSTLAQVWAALVVFGAIAIREAIRFQRDRMEQCFQLCVFQLREFDSLFKLFNKNVPNFLANQIEMNQFLNQSNVLDVFKEIPPISLPPSEEDKIRSLKIAAAINYNKAYNDHLKNSENYAKDLTWLFLNGVILIGICMLCLAISKILANNVIFYWFVAGGSLGWSAKLVKKLFPIIAQEVPSR